MSAGAGLTGLTGLAGALDSAAEAARMVGLDQVGPLASIREFADGPVVITVCAEAADRAGPVLPLISAAGTGAVVQQVSLGEVSTPALRDLLIVASQADRALSLAETDVVRASRAGGSVVALALTDTDVFGGGAARDEAISEIERLRLRPMLEPLGVPWFILGTAAADEALTQFIRQSLTARSTSHDQAGWAVLRATASAMLGEIAPRLAEHAEQARLLNRAQADLDAVRARLEQEAQLTVMSVRTALRGAEQDVYAAGLAMPGRVAELPDDFGPAKWADAQAPLLVAWDRCVEVARTVVERSRTRFAAELTRLDPATPAGQQPRVIAGLSTSWETDSLRQALARLGETDLADGLIKFRPRAGQDAASDAWDESRDDSLVGRISARVRRVQEDKLAASLPERLNAVISRAVGPGIQAVVTAATAATTTGTAADVAAALSAYAQRLSDQRADHDGQRRWQVAHDLLCELTPHDDAGARGDDTARDGANGR